MVFKTARGIVVEGGSSDRDALGIMIDEAETATEILGLPSDASGGEVRAAYIRLAKEYHPDTHPGDLAAERRFQRISKAYNDLRSPYHVLRGARTHDAARTRGGYRQVLAIAIMVFVLTPSAVFIVMRSEERSVPSLAVRQVKGVASKETGDASGIASEETTAALKMDKGLSAGDSAKNDRLRGPASIEAQSLQAANKAQRSPEASPQGEARLLGLHAPPLNHEFAIASGNETVQPQGRNEQTKIASVQPEIQDKRERGEEPQVPPRKAAAERAGERFIVQSNTITPDNKQRMAPRPAMSAKAALLKHSLDRTALTAAPGG